MYVQVWKCHCKSSPCKLQRYSLIFITISDLSLKLYCILGDRRSRYRYCIRRASDFFKANIRIKIKHIRDVLSYLDNKCYFMKFITSNKLWKQHPSGMKFIGYSIANDMGWISQTLARNTSRSYFTFSGQLRFFHCDIISMTLNQRSFCPCQCKITDKKLTANS